MSLITLMRWFARPLLPFIICSLFLGSAPLRSDLQGSSYYQIEGGQWGPLEELLYLLTGEFHVEHAHLDAYTRLRMAQERLLLLLDNLDQMEEELSIEEMGVFQLLMAQLVAAGYGDRLSSEERGELILETETLLAYENEAEFRFWEFNENIDNTLFLKEEVLLTGDFLDALGHAATKCAKKTRKFVKKHKTAIIIGTAAVVGVGGAVIYCSAAAPAATTAAISAVTSLFSSDDKGKHSSSGAPPIQISQPCQPAAPPAFSVELSQEEPVCSAILMEQPLPLELFPLPRLESVAAYRDWSPPTPPKVTLDPLAIPKAWDPFAPPKLFPPVEVATSRSWSIESLPSHELAAPPKPAVGLFVTNTISMLVHEAWDVVDQAGHVGGQLYDTITGGLAPTVDQLDNYFAPSVTSWREITLEGHQKIDQFFGTEQASEYSQSDNALIPLAKMIICLSPQGRALHVAGKAKKVFRVTRAVKRAATVAEQISIAQKQIQKIEPVKQAEQRAIAVFNKAVGKQAPAAPNPIRIQPNGTWDIAGRNIKTFNFEKVVRDNKKLEHLFNDKHNLERLGHNQEAILTKITKAVIEADKAGNVPQGAPFAIKTTIEAHEVEIRGIVLEGELRYGTFFIPD